jgi:hypothetical protein
VRVPLSERRAAPLRSTWWFGPTAPEGEETSWMQTTPGRQWFSNFRFYGPLEPYFDRSWKLGDTTAT